MERIAEKLSALDDESAVLLGSIESTARSNPPEALKQLQRVTALQLRAVKLSEPYYDLLPQRQQRLLRASEAQVLHLNAMGVQALRAGAFDEASEHLQAALRMVEGAASTTYFPHAEVALGSEGAIPPRARLLASTLNNMGCLERRRGNFAGAMKYFSMSTKSCDSMSPVTLLNMAATSMASRNFEDAVTNARKAITLLQGGAAVPMAFPGLAVVAHHVVALVSEANDPTEAHVQYKLAVESARRDLGNAHSVTALIQRNMLNFVQSRRQSNSPLDAANGTGGDESPAANGPQLTEDVLQSGDLATAVMMDTAPVRAKLRPSNAPQPAPPPKAGQPRVAGERGRQSVALSSGAGQAAKGNSGQPAAPGVSFPALPRGLDLGASQLEDEERRKEDLLAYLYGRLKELVRNEEGYEQQYSAAVRIQCAWRKARSRKKVKRLLQARALASRRRLERENAAGRTVVRYLKRIVALRKLSALKKQRAREERLTRESAAVRIQSTVRRWLAQQYALRLRHYRSRYFEAVRTVQTFFRNVLSRHRARRMKSARKEAEEYLRVHYQRHYAATQIQKVYRAHRARIDVLMLKGDVKAAREMDWQSNRLHAAIRIQRVWRGFLVRKVTSATLRRQKRMRLTTNRTNSRRQAATTIQRVFKGALCRQQHQSVAAACSAARTRCKALVEVGAASKIQRAVRRYLSRVAVHLASTKREAERRMRIAAPHRPFAPPEGWQFLRRERMLI